MLRVTSESCEFLREHPHQQGVARKLIRNLGDEFVVRARENLDNLAELFEALGVDGETGDEIVAQPVGCPDSKLRFRFALDAVADRQDYVEVVMGS